LDSVSLTAYLIFAFMLCHICGSVIDLAYHSPFFIHHFENDECYSLFSKDE